MMRTLAAGLLCVCAGAFAAAPIAAAAANEPDLPMAGDTPGRPGGGTHFSRGGFEFDNRGHPVTGQGPNPCTQALKDALEDAGVPHRGL